MSARRKALLEAFGFALPPTLTALATMAMIEWGTHQRTLFGPLAVSAFLVYGDAEHRMNGTWTMVIAHVTALLSGTIMALTLGPGYPAAALAMAITIVILVVARRMHPPAIGTCLAFAFAAPQPSAIPVFLAALALTALLFGAQRVIIRFVRRVF